MDTVVEALILDLLEWVAKRERRTSCPKLPVWEDANDRGLLQQQEVDGCAMVYVTPRGLDLLQRASHST